MSLLDNLTTYFSKRDSCEIISSNKKMEVGQIEDKMVEVNRILSSFWRRIHNICTDTGNQPHSL